MKLEICKKLGKVEFDDRFEVSTDQKSSPKIRLRGTKRLHEQSKTVNCLEKLGDPEFVPQAERSDTITPSPQNAIGVREKEL